MAMVEGDGGLYDGPMAVKLKTTEASATWRALLVAFTSVGRSLADEMEAETGLSLERYEILLMLSQTEGGAMRPSALADDRRLSRSGATRLIDRLERDGLVERRSCDTDRRGSFVALTPEGEEAFRRAGRVHLRGIDEHVGSHLSPGEMAEIRRVLAKLARPATGGART
jgi:DNA-binding MarR family transcriptional regulator